MVLKNISPGCGIRVSLMLFFIFKTYFYDYLVLFFISHNSWMAFREAVLITEPYGDLLKGKAEVNYSYFFSDDYNEKYIHTYICAFSGFS